MSGKVVRAIALGALFAGVISAPLLAAPPATPAQLVNSRINSFKELAAAFKNVQDELKRDDPRFMYIQISAREVNTASRDQYSWFPVGTAAPLAKSRAKAEIWKQPAQFKAAQDAFAAQAKVMMDVVAGKDFDKMRAQAKALGETCSDCHRSYRVE